jgi:hypothetical protein
MELHLRKCSAEHGTSASAIAIANTLSQAVHYFLSSAKSNDELHYVITIAISVENAVEILHRLIYPVGQNRFHDASFFREKFVESLAVHGVFDDAYTMYTHAAQLHMYATTFMTPQLRGALTHFKLHAAALPEIAMPNFEWLQKAAATQIPYSIEEYAHDMRRVKDELTYLGSFYADTLREPDSFSEFYIHLHEQEWHALCGEGQSARNWYRLTNALFAIALQFRPAVRRPTNFSMVVCGLEPTDEDIYMPDAIRGWHSPVHDGIVAYGLDVFMAMLMHRAYTLIRRIVDGVARRGESLSRCLADDFIIVQAIAYWHTYEFESDGVRYTPPLFSTRDTLEATPTAGCVEAAYHRLPAHIEDAVNLDDVRETWLRNFDVNLLCDNSDILYDVKSRRQVGVADMRMPFEWFPVAQQQTCLHELPSLRRLQACYRRYAACKSTIYRRHVVVKLITVDDRFAHEGARLWQLPITELEAMYDGHPTGVTFTPLV